MKYIGFPLVILMLISCSVSRVHGDLMLRDLNTKSIQLEIGSKNQYEKIKVVRNDEDIRLLSGPFGYSCGQYDVQLGDKFIVLGKIENAWVKIIDVTVKDDLALRVE